MRISLIVSPAVAGMLALAGCAHPRPAVVETVPKADSVAPARCWTCTTIPMEDDLERAVTARIGALRDRGGACETYGLVLDASLRSGRISIRPTMWRHEGRLVAGEAAPNGDMNLAREIDSLNVGRRGIDEIIWTMEHEAVHIAFGIPSTTERDESVVNSRVRSCRS